MSVTYGDANGNDNDDDNGRYNGRYRGDPDDNTGGIQQGDHRVVTTSINQP